MPPPTTRSKAGSLSTASICGSSTRRIFRCRSRNVSGLRRRDYQATASENIGLGNVPQSATANRSSRGERAGADDLIANLPDATTPPESGLTPESTLRGDAERCLGASVHGATPRSCCSTKPPQRSTHRQSTPVSSGCTALTKGRTAVYICALGSRTVRRADRSSPGAPGGGEGHA